MVRLKGNSPKVSGKESNRPRTIKNFSSGTTGMSSGIGGVSIGGI
jgi:hypothetical protein